jgi:hypothetical protein
MTSEDRLVLLLARGTLQPRAQEEALALLSTPLRWDLVLEQATRQEVYPLLHRNLQWLGVPSVPEEVRGALRAQCRVNAFRNTLMAEELAGVLRLLHDADIPAIPLKGVALARTLYGDPALRVSCDLDVLVPPDRMARAFDLLLGNGYRSESANRFIDRLTLRGRSSEYAIGLKKAGPEGDYLLELHRRLMWEAPCEKQAIEDLWAEARPCTCFGAPAYALSPEWELLYLAAHAAHHRWQGLKWLVDIHEACAAPNWDWPRLLEKAKRLRWDEILSLTLSACHTLFGTPLPEGTPLRTLPPEVRLFPASHGVEFRHQAFFFRHLMTHPLDRLRFLLRGLFVPTPPDQWLFRLPPSLDVLYYPLRIVRLGGKLCRSLAGAGKGR